MTESERTMKYIKDLIWSKRYYEDQIIYFKEKLNTVNYVLRKINVPEDVK